MEGILQVTGNEDPASSGNPMSWAVSTISLDHSHFQDRCLSLKTGTVRPSCLKTSTISLKNS